MVSTLRQKGPFAAFGGHVLGLYMVLGPVGVGTGAVVFNDNASIASLEQMVMFNSSNCQEPSHQYLQCTWYAPPPNPRIGSCLDCGCQVLQESDT